MKQLLFLLLFLLPCLAWAQYPSNGNQKITLGEQTTADGLIYRGLAADTTRKPSVDTMAYIILDTATNIQWHYKKATSNAWLRLNLLPSDTASMLTNYWRSGRFSGTLPVANGGTNLTTFTGAWRVPYASSTTQLTTNSNFRFEDNILYVPSAIYNGVTNYGYTFAAGNASATAGLGIFIRGTQGSEPLLPTTFGKPYINIGGFENKINAIQSIGFGFTNGTGGYLSPAEIGYITNSVSGYTNGSLVFATRETTNNLAPEEKMRITTNGEVNIGYGATDNGAYLLQVKDSVYVGGNVSAAAYTTRSDFNLKDDIFDLKYGLNDILKLQPVEYTYKSNGSKQLGFIAQDIGTILPEVVSFEESMSVNYQAIIPILTKAIQEQQALIKALEQRIINLENK